MLPETAVGNLDRLHLVIQSTEGAVDAYHFIAGSTQDS